MANFFTNTSNLFLTAVFFHTLLPVSCIIALFGLIFSYNIEKVSLSIPPNNLVYIVSTFETLQASRTNVRSDGSLHR